MRRAGGAISVPKPQNAENKGLPRDDRRSLEVSGKVLDIVLTEFVCNVFILKELKLCQQNLGRI
jgi:hypothetical protein